MKKLAVEETYPKNEIAKNMIYNKMKSHYRRIFGAKAKVDTNLPKPQKNSETLSKEICEIVERNYYCYKHLPKHRRCLMELESSDFQFKPIILNTNTESKLKTLNVYHPPVRTPRRTKSRQQEEAERTGQNTEKDQSELCNEEENVEQVEDSKEPEEQRTVIEKVPPVLKKEMFVQTDRLPKYRSKKPSTYRPRSSRSLHFLRDVTDDVLRKGVYTDESLERIFEYHVTVNKHNIDMDTMLNEIDRLRDEVGMPRPGLRMCSHSDEEALEALDSLQLDPVFKEDIITSLRLRSRESYHSAVINSPSSLSELSSQKRFKIEEKLQPSEKECSNSKMHQSPKIVLKEQNDMEMASTASEVSDIQEIEFEDVRTFINEQKEELAENNSNSESGKTKSLSKDSSKAEESKEIHSEKKSSVELTHSRASPNDNSSEIKEQLIHSQINEYNDKDELKKSGKISVILSEKAGEVVKEIQTYSDDHPSFLPAMSAEIITESIMEESEPEEEEDDDDDDVDEEENIKTEDDLIKSQEISESNNSSDMSSIHTEPSDSN